MKFTNIPLLNKETLVIKFSNTATIKILIDILFLVNELYIIKTENEDNQ